MANKYLSASLGTRNWNDTTGTWVTSNGGTTPTTAPTTADTAFLTSLSGNITCTTATDACGTINATGYTGTLTINSSCKLSVPANVTFSATMTLTNNGTFEWTTSTTTGALINTGIDIPGAVSISSTTRTLEFGSNVSFLGIVTIGNQTTFNNSGGSRNVYFKAGVIGANAISGSVSIYLQGGTVSSKFGTANVYLDGNITFRTGTNTFAYVGFGYTTACNVEWLSGTVTSTPSYVEVRGPVTFNTGSDVLFNKLQFNPTAAHTVTLADDLYVKDILIEGTSGASTIIDGAYKIKVSGNIRSYTTNAFYSNYFKGTATFEMVGTGTLGLAQNFAGSSSSKGVTYIENSIIINTAGTTTFGNIGVSGSGTLTYTTGTIAGSGGIYVVGTYSITGTFTLPVLYFGGNDRGVSTYNSGPYVCNLLTNITINNLTINYNSTLNITDTKIITVATTILSRGNWANNNVIASSGAGYINYLGNCNVMNLVYTDFTNITATPKHLAVYKGTLTNCSNIEAVDLNNLGGNNFTLFN